MTLSKKIMNRYISNRVLQPFDNQFYYPHFRIKNSFIYKIIFHRQPADTIEKIFTAHCFTNSFNIHFWFRYIKSRKFSCDIGCSILLLLGYDTIVIHLLPFIQDYTLLLNIAIYTGNVVIVKELLYNCYAQVLLCHVINAIKYKHFYILGLLSANLLAHYSLLEQDKYLLEYYSVYHNDYKIMSDMLVVFNLSWSSICNLSLVHNKYNIFEKTNVIFTTHYIDFLFSQYHWEDINKRTFSYIYKHWNEHDKFYKLALKPNVSNKFRYKLLQHCLPFMTHKQIYESLDYLVFYNTSIDLDTFQYLLPHAPGYSSRYNIDNISILCKFPSYIRLLYPTMHIPLPNYIWDVEKINDYVDTQDYAYLENISDITLLGNVSHFLKDKRFSLWEFGINYPIFFNDNQIASYIAKFSKYGLYTKISQHNSSLLYYYFLWWPEQCIDILCHL